MSLSLYDLKQTINTISSDYIRSPGCAVASGSANVYTAILIPVPTTYVDGMCVSFDNFSILGASPSNAHF